MDNFADFPWGHVSSAVVAAIGGGYGTGFVMRYMVTKTIKDLHKVMNEVNALTQKLAVFETQLSPMTGIKRMLLDHDRKITELGARQGIQTKPNSWSESSVSL